jgi:hypothetical protein
MGVVLFLLAILEENLGQLTRIRVHTLTALDGGISLIRMETMKDGLTLSKLQC